MSGAAVKTVWELAQGGAKKAIPASAGEAVGQVAGAPGAGVSRALGDGSFTQYENQASATDASPDSAGIGTSAVQALPESNQKANIGIDQAAKIESEVGTPVGDAVKKTGLETNQESLDLIHKTKQDYHDAVQGAIQATTNAESALNDAAQKAAIDPQAYLHTLGVGDKLMASIGMALSGIGSGVTGQPNLAMDLYKKNMDAAIQAQAQEFQNMMEVSAQKQGLIKTAQDKQQIAANAYNAAVMSVTAGSNVAIQGTMAQIKSATAVPLAAQLQNQNNMMNSQAIDRHSSDFSSKYQSNDASKMTLMGDAAKTVIDHLTGNSKRTKDASQAQPANRIGRPLPQGAQSKADSSNDFDRQLYEREQQQAAREQAITGKKPASPNATSGGFLKQYGDQ